MMTIAILSLAGFQASSLDEAFGAYEKIRALLADDKVEGVGREAERLEKAAAKAAEGASQARNPHFREIAGAAAPLKDAKDLPAARRAFGNLSREVVELLAAEPALARGRFVYRCPMVKEGYAKWVQTKKEVSNPYFGKEMLRCGTPAELED